MRDNLFYNQCKNILISASTVLHFCSSQLSPGQPPSETCRSYRHAPSTFPAVLLSSLHKNHPPDLEKLSSVSKWMRCTSSCCSCSGCSLIVHPSIMPNCVMDPPVHRHRCCIRPKKKIYESPTIIGLRRFQTQISWLKVVWVMQPFTPDLLLLGTLWVSTLRSSFGPVNITPCWRWTFTHLYAFFARRWDKQWERSLWLAVQCLAKQTGALKVKQKWTGRACCYSIHHFTHLLLSHCIFLFPLFTIVICNFFYSTCSWLY